MSLRRKPHTWISLGIPEEYGSDASSYRCKRCPMEKLVIAKKHGKGPQIYFKSPTIGGWKLHVPRVDCVPGCMRGGE